MTNVTFKNTEEAIKYGQGIKGNNKAIENLKDLRVFYIGKVSWLMEQGLESEALHLASGQSQFTREAIEEAIKA